MWHRYWEQKSWHRCFINSAVASIEIEPIHLTYRPCVQMSIFYVSTVTSFTKERGVMGRKGLWLFNPYPAMLASAAAYGPVTLWPRYTVFVRKQLHYEYNRLSFLITWNKLVQGSPGEQFFATSARSYKIFPFLLVITRALKITKSIMYIYW
jgi:hypothetical protein